MARTRHPSRAVAGVVSHIKLCVGLRWLHMTRLISALRDIKVDEGAKHVIQKLDLEIRGNGVETIMLPHR